MYSHEKWQKKYKNYIVHPNQMYSISTVFEFYIDHKAEENDKAEGNNKVEL